MILLPELQNGGPRARARMFVFFSRTNVPMPNCFPHQMITGVVADAGSEKEAGNFLLLSPLGRLRFTLSQGRQPHF